MSNVFIYLIQSSIVFSILYSFYKIFYSHTTFYKLNRTILLLTPIVAVLIPLSHITIFNVSSSIIDVPEFYKFVSNGKEIIADTIKNSASKSFSLIDFLPYLYIIGCFIFLLKFILSIKLIFKIKNQSKLKTDGEFSLFFTNESDTFSFLNWIFISKKHNSTDFSLIITHEKAHAHLKHTFDLIFSEVFIIFFWFNPLVYVYRKSLKSVHEYQADTWVLNKEVKKSTYLQALLDNIQLQSSNNLYNYFNQSVIKKRIDMITKNPTRKMYKLSYLLITVCTVILCLAFTKPNIVNELVPKLNHTNFENSHPRFLFPVKNKNRTDITSVYGQKGRFSKNTSNKIHQGIDIKAPIGTPIVATADGIIMKASNEKAWGNLIVMNHREGYQTWYAHLDSFKVKEQQTVTKGEIIGYVGNTGLSTGPHLHYEVRLNDKHIDPLDVIVE